MGRHRPPPRRQAIAYELGESEVSAERWNDPIRSEVSIIVIIAPQVPRRSYCACFVSSVLRSCKSHTFMVTAQQQPTKEFFPELARRVGAGAAQLGSSEIFGMAVLLGSYALSVGMLVGASSVPRLTSVPRLVPIAEAQKTNVARIPKFLSNDDIKAIHATALAVGDETTTHDLHRRQGAPEGTWHTVFLNHRLGELLPDLHERMMDAAKEADKNNWMLLDDERHDINLRVAEYHRVSPGGGIPMKKHHDYGSLLTMDLMLSDGDGADFDGGNFQTLEPDGTLASHRFERGDLLIFQSHKYHCVSPVTAGRRSVLVCEVWEGLPRRCAKRCNEPWGACVCEFANPPPVLYQLAARGTLPSAGFSKLKPCLRHFSKTLPELDELAHDLAAAGDEAASEYEQLGAHRQWLQRKELDRQREEALTEAKRLVVQGGS